MSDALARFVAMGGIWAHSANVEGERHLLRDHLRGTAVLARAFAEPFGAGDAAFTVGLLHDAGKIAQPWQRRLLDLEAGRPAPSVDHKSLGAALAFARTLSPGAAAICGHHGGIPNVTRETIPTHADEELQRCLVEEVPEAAALLDGEVQLPEQWVKLGKDDPGIIEVGTRLLHSALVDADFLDTSAHFNAVPVQRPVPADFRALAGQFETRRAALLAERAPSPVDAARAEVYEACEAAAELPQGVFRLPAPTGAGKTLAAAGFALHHAVANRLRRVVVAVPFLTITEQNAAVYRNLLGDDVVLEHHSAVEPERLSRYGVENWDAPFVVTTTVQLFESLFSNRPSRTRKLHRLVGSVIVLDEVQALPTSVLPTILDGLRILVTHFGATVLLASATQPTVEALLPFRKWGVTPTEIIDDPPSLYRGMRRTSTEWRRIETREALERHVAAESRALVVVNTTADARDLARGLTDRGSGPVWHLSTRMCQTHRRRVLGEVRVRLALGDPVTLVSTQLIEAGVDVDFPVVFRAMAPAESLLQAGGRVNREGRLRSGRLIVVDCPELGSLRAYATGIAKTRAVFGEGDGNLDDPEAMRRYYESLYAALGLEAQRGSSTMEQNRRDLSFRTVAEDFRMIDDDSESVVVLYDDEVRGRVRSIQRHVQRRGTPTREQFRALQPYSVALPRRVVDGPTVRPYVDEPVPGLRVWTGSYDGLVGIDLDVGPQDTVW